MVAVGEPSRTGLAHGALQVVARACMVLQLLELVSKLRWQTITTEVLPMWHQQAVCRLVLGWMPAGIAGLGTPC